MAIDPVKVLKGALTDRLHLDPRKHPISVKMENGAIVMEGMVENIAQKKKALLMAMGIEGTTGVVDRLKVTPSARMTDEEIKKHLYDAIAGEPALKGYDITAEVRDGVVDLEGKVISLSHKRLAGVFAWWVPGSMDVINSLEVDPPEDDTDDEVADAVRIVLEKDRLVDASEMTVGVRNWVVTLEGIARSEAEREAAEEDAWYVWGVNEVINRIKV